MKVETILLLHLRPPTLPKLELMLKLSTITTCSFRIQIWVPSTICSTGSQCCACRKERGIRSSAWTGCSWRRFTRSASAQTWTPMDGWYLGDSPGWFGSILSVDSPHHWATGCSLKVEPTSVLCSSHPPRLKGLASLQPAIAFCPVPSRGPHRAFGMKSARNKRSPHAQSHRNWGLHG